MTAQTFRLAVDDWLGGYRECNECQRQAHWLVREVGYWKPTFRCWLHLWYAFDRVTADLRSHEPPRTEPGELEHDPQPSARRD